MPYGFARFWIDLLASIPADRMVGDVPQVLCTHARTHARMNATQAARVCCVCMMCIHACGVHSRYLHTHCIHVGERMLTHVGERTFTRHRIHRLPLCYKFCERSKCCVSCVWTHAHKRAQAHTDTHKRMYAHRRILQGVFHACMHTNAHGRTDGRTDGQTDRQTDRPTDRPTDRRMDECLKVCSASLRSLPTSCAFLQRSSGTQAT